MKLKNFQTISFSNFQTFRQISGLALLTNIAKYLYYRVMRDQNPAGFPRRANKSNQCVSGSLRETFMLFIGLTRDSLSQPNSQRRSVAALFWDIYVNSRHSGKRNADGRKINTWVLWGVTWRVRMRFPFVFPAICVCWMWNLIRHEIGGWLVRFVMRGSYVVEGNFVSSDDDYKR